MTVISSDPTPSRADSLALIGGNLALDFANTQSGLGFPSHCDHLRSVENVTDWLIHAKAVSAKDALLLRDRTSGNSSLAADLVGSALALREAIHDAAVAIGHGRSPAPEALAVIARLHARCIGRASLEQIGGACGWRWDMNAAPVETALGPVALTAIDLVTNADRSRVKECEGYACGWLFYDASKSNRRRWCEMEVCGNRAKQKRLAARRRGG